MPISMTKTHTFRGHIAQDETQYFEPQSQQYQKIKTRIADNVEISFNTSTQVTIRVLGPDGKISSQEVYIPVVSLDHRIVYPERQKKRFIRQFVQAVIDYCAQKYPPTKPAAASEAS